MLRPSSLGPRGKAPSVAAAAAVPRKLHPSPSSSCQSPVQDEGDGQDEEGDGDVGPAPARSLVRLAILAASATSSLGGGGRPRLGNLLLVASLMGLFKGIGILHEIKMKGILLFYCICMEMRTRLPGRMSPWSTAAFALVWAADDEGEEEQEVDPPDILRILSRNLCWAARDNRLRSLLSRCSSSVRPGLFGMSSSFSSSSGAWKK